MFSIFKAKEEPTFKKRVQDFWDWYSEVAPRFFETIEAGSCPSLSSEVSEHVDKLLPGFAWVFGSGENGVGHSLTLCGEGVFDKQLLSQFWHSQAPKLAGWIFYPARQPGAAEGFVMKVEGRDFKPSEFWFTPTINMERQKVDIVAWHPLFGVLERKSCMFPLFLFLDEVLGEYGTGQWIGEITLHDQKLTEAIPLGELLQYIKLLQAKTGWKKFPPGEVFTLYNCKTQDENFLRGDTIAGSTVHTKLINEYLKTHGNLDDPLAGTGADYIFITIDAAWFPKQNCVAARGVVEDALNNRLAKQASGRLLGGAFGKKYAYIDLMIFDGEESLKTVKSVLAEQKVPSGTGIHYFAKEKRGYRIVL